ncbi:MAG: type II toxin-antitoxin system VapC family toxin [Cyclobacteriaceae bacterium]|nr:type II toxin-antitoxin system VapC family toxin [Cyclobacteriaceae bacterium]
MAKEKVICDTDVLIDFWDKKNARHLTTANVLEKEIGFDYILMSAITKMELMVGAKNKKELNEISEKLNRFPIILINDKVCLRALDLLQQYHLSQGLALPDCLIAATALETGLKLFTYNTRDFKFIPDLVLYNF